MKMSLRVAALAAGVLFGSARAFAAPTHYVVFEVAPDGRTSPVYYTQVDMTADRSASRAEAAGAHDADEVVYRLRRQGTDLGLRSVEVPHLRGEFARDPERGDGSIVAARPGATTRSFVVRVPIGEADAIEFGAGASAQKFDFVTLAADAADFRLARVAVPQIEHVQGGGSPANRVDMLVFGDGYTAAQQSLFDADAVILHDSFFGITPYQEYESFVNWTTAFVASNQSGADHPPYQAGCTQSTCCSDTDAVGDTHAGQYVDTAFNATFCAYQIQRLLVVDDSAVLAAASAYPDWDKIVIVVNDDTYGGSGGELSVTSTHAQAPQIVLHEYGHSFTRLADEYSSPYPGYPACSDLSGSAPCEANVTDETTASLVKWQSWFTPGNPIPTPAGTSGVGLFQGARYLSSGMYRPVYTQCLMQYLGMPFCPVCRQEYVRTLYRGGWGVPAGGIDLIEPGSESPAPGSPVDYTPGTTLVFGATLLAPTIGTLDVEWLLDGSPIGGANAPSYAFSQSSSTPATRSLELRVTDATSYVSAAMTQGLLVHSRIWTIQVGNDVIFSDGFDGGP